MNKFKVGDRVTAGDNFNGEWRDITITGFSCGSYDGIDAVNGEGAFHEDTLTLLSDAFSEELQELRAFKAEALAAGYAPKAAVDGDLLEARAIVAATYQSLDEREWDHYANSLIAGKNDDDVEVKCALAGVKRGRELATQEARK